MSVSNFALLIRELRKKDRREALDHLRDPDLIRRREKSPSGDVRTRRGR